MMKRRMNNKNKIYLNYCNKINLLNIKKAVILE